MRFHVPALPGRPTTRANSHCAYSGYVRKFCRMMREAGHEVFLYGGGGNDARASAYIACYPDYDEPVPFDSADFTEPNARAAAEIVKRREPGDFLCIIGGESQRTIAAALPDMMAVEYRVGYGGVFSDFRVFETYAWMHIVYGHLYGTHSAYGRFYDSVIPPPFEVEDFPFVADKDDYLLYMGRMIPEKGVQAASDLAERIGMPLLMAGEGETIPEYGDYLGAAGPDERAELMSHARALVAPTSYVEPGGGVAIEAQLCGTPVLSTDWGCFTETVIHGVTGYRCRTLGEFAWAAENVDVLDTQAIRDYAVANYSLEAIGPRYEAYFEQLQALDVEGWYSGWEGLSGPGRQRGIALPGGSA